VTECTTPSSDFLPKFQKNLQFWEIWAEVVVLPDVGLQQPGMVSAGTGWSRWLDRTLLAASENLERSRESPGSLMVQVFHYLGYGKPKNNYCS
jgi:hypothetical protein